MMHVGGGGGGGSFTPSQWMELEHQALIYKYLTSNVPVPPNLLIPIRKALESAAFSSPAGLLRPNTLGWVGPFHLGLTSNGDLEPGRCRRTDGKKWRCSRDAVPDQKYCERHINRGRHRSRKPVEVRSAHHSIASATTNHITATNAAAAAAAAKGIPAAAITTGASAAAAAAAAALATSRGYGGGSSCNIPAQLHHHQHHHRNDNDLLDSIPLSRMFVEEVTGGLKSNERSSSFMNSKQQHNPYAESSLQTEFGLVSSESLLNPSQKPPSSSSSLISCRSFSSSEDQQQHSLRQFMDNWPKAHQPDHFGSSHSWQETADRTELSISIPVARNPADFMSSSSSPDNEKLNVSPQELDQVHRQANWNSMSWENSMGGPLGEVLQNTNNNGSNGRRVGNQEGKSSSSLSLMTEGWDSSRASSPTEVLQKTTFVWLSNSSTGSSPRAAREQH